MEHIFYLSHQLLLPRLCSSSLPPAPIFISKLLCSKGPNLPSFLHIFKQNRIFSIRLFQKDCAQFHPSFPHPATHLSTNGQKKRCEIHFISKLGQHSILQRSAIPYTINQYPVPFSPFPRSIHRAQIRTSPGKKGNL